MDIQSIKQRFGIIGNAPLLNRGIDVAAQVAHTDLSVLITGESGVGKEFFPKIIHQLSARKHASYIAINCGAIPDGTIDSELFGHEKGSFTDAREARRGYFEVANGGTLFLDEVAELPLSTQARLLRVLESGEFLKVGSSSVLKTNVRVVAATNVNIPEAITKGKFREDLYYRLNAISIFIPPLRERKEDIELLFRKFSSDLSEKYRIQPLQLSPGAKEYLMQYPWKGNIRELKNITEQMSILEKTRLLSLEALRNYLPDPEKKDLPLVLSKIKSDSTYSGMTERDILYKILFDMQKDVQDLKRIVGNIDHHPYPGGDNRDTTVRIITPTEELRHPEPIYITEKDSILSIEEKEKELIIRALQKYTGNRRKAAKELGISERTIYRKIKELNIEVN